MECKYIFILVLYFNSKRMVKGGVKHTIPTKQEQANLLLNVQEVFEEVKLLIKEEGENTDTSFKEELGLMVKRADLMLGLLEEITLLRLSCDSNKVCTLEYPPKVKEVTAEGKESLKSLLVKSVSNIESSSLRLSNSTNLAIDRGQLLLDDLGDCSQKNGLAVIGCYKKIIATDVIPVKRELLAAIQAHKEENNKVIGIRKDVNVYIDETLKNSRNLLDKILSEALSCI